MGANASNCRPCSHGDSTTDTVQVDATLLAHGDGSPKAPVEAQVTEEERLRQIDAEKQLLEEQRLAEAARQAEEQRQREAEERLERERVEAEEEAKEKHRQRHEQELKARAEEERRLAEAARLESERAAAVMEETKKKAQKTVDEFLRKRGFKSVAAPRKALFCGGATYPLQLAVEQGDEELVKAMMLCGAVASQKITGGKTIREFADKCNKNGSHSQVVVALNGQA